MKATSTTSPFAPAPGAAAVGRMFLAQTGMELRLLVRNGEQVMLTLVIPLLLLFFFNLPLRYSLGGPRIDFVVPSILALAVMSSAFTGLAMFGLGVARLGKNERPLFVRLNALRREIDVVRVLITPRCFTGCFK